jgi:Membrane bound O-acyl transferase family
MLSMTQSAVSLAPAAKMKRFTRAAWIPLAILPTAVCLFRARFLPWEFMWLLSLAIFFGFKWETWYSASVDRTQAGWRRNAGYLFLWPGMDAPKFLASDRPVARIKSREWAEAFGKTLGGAALVGFVAHRPLATNTLFDGWLGMLGMVLLLHFGLFHLVSLTWRVAGVDAQPIMRAPAASTSLSEFWGKRWNLGFRQLTHGLVYEPLRRQVGSAAAILAAFLASGIIHDLVISFPAGGGYGLPTSYFLLQGIGVLFEKSMLGRRLGIDHGIRGWLYVLLCVSAPAYFLFHPLFIKRVMLPFFAFLGGHRTFVSMLRSRP